MMYLLQMNKLLEDISKDNEVTAGTKANAQVASGERTPPSFSL